MRTKKYNKIISLTEIVLLVTMSFAVSYMIHEADKGVIVINKKESL